MTLHQTKVSDTWYSHIVGRPKQEVICASRDAQVTSCFGRPTKFILSFYPRTVLASGYCRCLCLCVCVSITCLLVCTITRHLFKLGSPNLVQRSKTPWLRFTIVLGDNWPWPSRSNLTSNSKLTPFWACPNHYSPPILVRISKFGQQMHFSTVKIPVNSGLDWSWTSPSFLIPKLIYLHCGGVHWDCETVHRLFQCCSGTVSQTLHQCTWERTWGL